MSAITTHPRYMADAKTRTGSNIISHCCAGPRRKAVLPDIQNKVGRSIELNPGNWKRNKI